MASGVLTSLSLVFLVSGITLWLTSLSLARRARFYQAGMHSLLQLASQNLEPLEIPAAAWPVLQDAGWQSLSWEGDWYGQPVQGALGRTDAAAPPNASDQTFEIVSGDEVRLMLHLCHGVRGGERRLFAVQLAQVFVLLLETRLRERTGALSAALAERARLSLYLQHDMRNMAQWVSWVSADFAGAKDAPALLAAAQRLKENAPLAQERALRLNAALGKSPQLDTPRCMDLGQALEQAARLAGLAMLITGEAQAFIAPGALERALDNLLSKLAIDWRAGHAAQACAALESVVQDGAQEAGEQQATMARVRLSCPLPASSLELAPEKLFEPFASGRPGGLGLGLYQARKSLREAGGDLVALVEGDQLCFVLHLPQQSPSVQGSTFQPQG
jgi:hypothetical protein